MGLHVTQPMRRQIIDVMFRVKARYGLSDDSVTRAMEKALGSLGLVQLDQQVVYYLPYRLTAGTVGAETLVRPKAAAFLKR
jgi:hypothetical protein